MTVIDRLVDIVKVEPLDGFKARIEFEDGAKKVVDLEKYLHGPIFEPIRRDPAFFRSMSIVDGTITWPNEADIDSEVLYYDLKPAWMEAQLEADKRNLVLAVRETQAPYTTTPNEKE